MALGQAKCATAAIEVDTMRTAAQSLLAHGRAKLCNQKEEVNDHGLLGASSGTLSAEDAASSGLMENNWQCPLSHQRRRAVLVLSHSAAAVRL